MTKKRILQLLLFFFVIALVLTGCSKNDNTPAPQNQPENDPEVPSILSGAELVDARCDQCHTQDRITRDRGDEEWLEHARRMLSKSPDLFTEEEFDLVVTHLQQEY